MRLEHRLMDLQGRLEAQYRVQLKELRAGYRAEALAEAGGCASEEWT